MMKFHRLIKNSNFLNLKNIPYKLLQKTAVINCFYKQNNKKFSRIEEKIYKLTFSGLDKYTSMEVLNQKLCELSEIKVLRLNKLQNKNYGHADIISKLDYSLLKIKFETIKILGKSLKVRIREVLEESNEILLKKYSYFDFEKLSDLENSKQFSDLKICVDNIFEYIHNFYLKNLTDNPISIKILLSHFVQFKARDLKEFDPNKINYDCFGENKLFEILNVEREIINYEYHINFNFDLSIGKSDYFKFTNQTNPNLIRKNSIDGLNKFILIPLKSHFVKDDVEKEIIEERKESDKFFKNVIDKDIIDIDIKEKSENFFHTLDPKICKNEKLNQQIKLVEDILLKFINLIKTLEYTSYEVIKNIGHGIYRNLNVKFNEDNIILNLMISSSKITIVDLKIIVDALKYEFSHLSKILSIYVSFNEKVIAETKNSSNYIRILGNERYLRLEEDKSNKDNFQEIRKLRIYPFDSEENLSYLKFFQLEDIFKSIDSKDFSFKNIFDLSSNFTPYGYLIHTNSENFIFFKDEYKFNLTDMVGDIEMSNIDIKKIIDNKVSQDVKESFYSFDEKINLQNGSLISKSNIKILKRHDIHNEINNKINLRESDLKLSLLVLNLKSFNLKLNQTLKQVKYQIIISNSFSQILDYLKIFSNLEYNISELKFKFVKDKNLIIKDIIMFIEIDHKNEK